MTKLRRTTLMTCLGAVLLGGCGQQAAQSEAQDASSVELKHPVQEADNNDFIVLTGTVVEAGDHAFELDYGDGWITVEMDDHDYFAEGKNLFENDRVIVYGYVDDDFYEQRTIEAQSVYVRNLGTQFYASGADEEDFPAIVYEDFYPRVTYRGEVVSVDGDEFVLDVGNQRLTVDTSPMPYDPLDEEGFQRLEKGDRVKVTGTLDSELFDLYELDARTVIELSSSSG